MKATAIITAACVASAAAFAPESVGRQTTQLLALKKPAPKKAAPAKAAPAKAAKAPGKPFFRAVFDMDLFAPNKEVNDYGARFSKKVTVGAITEKSYVPSGLTKAQYDALRKSEADKKKANYDKNVKKAGVFQDYTDFYTKRGTDTDDKWYKSATRGHTMAKTKYDFDSLEGKKGWFSN